MSQCRPDIIFVLAGQSNMAGRGDIGLAEPPDPDILMLSGEDGQVASHCWTRNVLCGDAVFLACRPFPYSRC
jgi:hypothetical protein